MLEEKKEHMNMDTMKTVSLAAANILDFIINIFEFYKNIVNFKPLEAKKIKAESDVEKASSELKDAEEKKEAAIAKVVRLNNELDEAVTTLNKVKEKVAELEWKQNLAERLVGGLKDEYVRWKNNVETLSKDMELIVGVTLISAGFVC